MATSTVVPLSDYLATAYRPDCDWIDGEVRERNMGEGPHALVQGYFVQLFGSKSASWGVCVLPEQRVHTSAQHYRIADVCVTRRSAPFEGIVRTAPLLCIEVLSRDDRMSEMQERVDDYLGMGVGTVWVVDPRRRKAFVAELSGMRQVSELDVAGTEIRVSVGEVFAELDEVEGTPAAE